MAKRLKLPVEVLRPELSVEANKALEEVSSRCRKTHQVYFNRQKLGYFTKLNGRFFLSASEALLVHVLSGPSSRS